MLSHGYEHGFRTLGRQILLEPIEWTDDGWPVAAADDLGGALAAPADASPQRAAEGFHDDFSTLHLGERWTFHAPSPGEVDRLRSDDGLGLSAKGTGPADTSPLCVLTGDHSYEVEVDIELGSGSTEAGLLLFFNGRLFCGMGIDGERMPSYSGGLRTHWREPAPPSRRMRSASAMRSTSSPGWYRAPGSEWVRHGVRYETSGYHANTTGDLLSLRPAIYAAGDGEVRFRDFRYRRSADARAVRPIGQRTRNSTACVRSSVLPDVEAEEPGLDDETRLRGIRRPEAELAGAELERHGHGAAGLDACAARTRRAGAPAERRSPRRPRGTPGSPRRRGGRTCW